MYSCTESGRIPFVGEKRFPLPPVLFSLRLAQILEAGGVKERRSGSWGLAVRAAFALSHSSVLFL